MRYPRYYVTCLLAGVVFAMAVGAGADTLVVKPGDMHGWTVATQTTSCGESPNGRFTVARAGIAPEDAGVGAFHFYTHPWDPCATPPYALEKIYLGTNNHSGVRLDEITSFKYYTYVHSRNFGSSGWPLGQPPMIELITDIPKPGYYDVWQQRRFVYKPWGWYGNDHNATDTWQVWDLMRSESGISHWEMIQTESTDIRGDWDWLVARYPEPGNPQNPHRLATPAVGDYTLGYLDQGDPGDWRLANQSGTSISIKVGSGKTSGDKGGLYWNPENHQWVPWAWWRESCGIDAYADKLVIGINDVETIYDLECGTSGVVGVVGIRPSHVRDRYRMINDVTKDNFVFAVFGEVMDNPAPDSTEFFLKDAAGGKVKVLAANSVLPGEFWRAKGTVEWDGDTYWYPDPIGFPNWKLKRYDVYSTSDGINLLE